MVGWMLMSSIRRDGRTKEGKREVFSQIVSVNCEPSKLRNFGPVILDDSGCTVGRQVGNSSGREQEIDSVGQNVPILPISWIVILAEPATRDISDIPCHSTGNDWWWSTPPQMRSDEQWLRSTPLLVDDIVPSVLYSCYWCLLEILIIHRNPVLSRNEERTLRPWATNMSTPGIFCIPSGAIW